MHNLGETKREAALNREVRFLNAKIPGSLSYKNIIVYSPENTYNISTDKAIEQNAAIIDTDNLEEKFIMTLPGESLIEGSLVYWNENFWLVAQRDADDTVYTRTSIIQCNHLLRWIGENNQIMEQWCIVEDGTKYLTGEMEDRQFIITRGDSRIAVTISRNSETVRFDRNRRFLIDDPQSPHKLAYTLSKPLKIGRVYNQQGIFKFVMQEVTATADDNHELGIAEYYKHFPKSVGSTHNDAGNETNKRVWL